MINRMLFEELRAARRGDKSREDAVRILRKAEAHVQRLNDELRQYDQEMRATEEALVFGQQGRDAANSILRVVQRKELGVSYSSSPSLAEQREIKELLKQQLEELKKAPPVQIAGGKS